MKIFAEVKDLIVKLGGNLILDNIHFNWEKNMCLAIIGDTGSGKTTLLKAIKGNLFHHGTIRFPLGKPEIALISRQHYFTNNSNLSSFYYQQRFNSFDSEDSPTVEEELSKLDIDRSAIDSLLLKVGLEHVKASRLISLSNGEHKRLQIVKALLKKADALLLDSPFTGLDVQARKLLNELLIDLRDQGIPILIVTGNTSLTEAVTHVAYLEKGKLSKIHPAKAYDPPKQKLLSIQKEKLQRIEPLNKDTSFDHAVQLINTTISYGNTTILDNINWKVKKGERWNLRGHNGSGKSTILSLINGDNPQAFSQEIYLFDKRKGTGESIWDIKQKTGFISPELHHYIEAGSSVFDMIASGLFDTMGLFRKLSDHQSTIVDQWIEVLHLERFKHRMFQSLSDGEQRKVLLARALVKNPPLLLLDEPCQGLDEQATAEFMQVIDAICEDPEKTVIYVSHYDAEIPSCVTKRLTLENGKIISMD